MFSVNRVETIYVVIDVIVIYRHICIIMMITYAMHVRIAIHTASVGMPSIVYLVIERGLEPRTI